ncbi:ganglioside GM2 activator [Elysia marginata]|uniref:Ganglioside GM2 activator n=1 Tax=Elysia marginata TaxID=1093978 RepID=A0AAV4FDV6_9GAST|nr:ganglioside GM2 activator [Elysia marginata]
MAHQIFGSLRACTLIALLLTIAPPGTESRRKSRRKALLGYADCGTGDDKIVHFHTVEATPIPVVVPGVLYLSLAGNVSADIPRRVNVYLSVKKYFFGFPFSVPCLSNGVGSCTYENICASLEAYEKYGCPPALGNGVQCHCPFNAGEFNLVDVPVNIPKIEGFASPLLNAKPGQARRGGDRKRKRSRRRKRKEGGGVSSGSEEKVGRDLGRSRSEDRHKRYPDNAQIGNGHKDVGYSTDDTGLKLSGGANKTLSDEELNRLRNHVSFSEDAQTYDDSQEGKENENVLNNRNSKRNIKRKRRGHKRRRTKAVGSASEATASRDTFDNLSRSSRVSRGLDDSLSSTERDRIAKRRRRRRRRRKRRKEKELKRRERERILAEKGKRKRMRRKKTSLVVPTASLPS